MTEPRYVTNEAGDRIGVLLDIDEYEQMQQHIKKLISLEQALPAAALALLTAPEDDELLTEEDIRAIEESQEDIQAGRIYSHEEARKLLFE